MDGESSARVEGAEADGVLVEAARAGDRGAFGRLYRRYARMVHGLLLAQVPAAEVEDLVHDVFLRAMRKLDGLRDGDAFGGWLASIARNRAVDHHRAQVPMLRVEAEAALPGSMAAGMAGMAGTVDGRASAEVQAHAVLAIIRELPLAYRETLVLRLVEGMTGPEIAERTGLTPESVRVNLHRGMKKLRERLAARPGGLL
jgi:RNA polymerase sigma-70 factor, ECF subfamily